MGKGWKGYYQQFGVKHPMTFTEFGIPASPDGMFHIQGSDEVGEFAMQGSVNLGKVKLVKQYTGAHQICYEGTFNGTAIEGTWGFEFGDPVDSFKIWME